MSGVGGAAVGSARLFGLPTLPPAAFNAMAHEVCGEGALVWSAPAATTTLTPTDLTGSHVARYVHGTDGAAAFTPDFEAAYRVMVERQRRALVAQELTTTYVIPIATDVPARLTELGATADELPHYCAGLRELREVAALMHRAWQAQIGYDPATAAAERTADDRELARRYGQPWGYANQHPLCVADPKIPPRGNGVVDAALATFNFGSDLKKDLTGFGNPFTVIAVGADGQPSLVPYAVRFAECLAPAAEHLRAAAEHLARMSRERESAAYLRAVAEAFENQALFPFQAADDAWIAQGKSASFLFLRIGPDETYADGVGDEHEVKALFHCNLGLRSHAVANLAEKYVPYLAQWEQTCTDLIGDSADYEAHEVHLQTPEMIDVMLQTGDDIGGPYGTNVGQTLPNWGGEDGQAEVDHRGMIYVNKSALAYKEEMLRRYILPLLDPVHHADFRGNGIGIEAIVRHEIVHNVGPKEGRAKPGTTSDYKGLMGQHANMVEELKAQTGSLYFATQLFAEARAAYRSGEMDAMAFAEVESWYRASILYDLVWAIAMVQRGTRTGRYNEHSTNYPKLAGIQLGFLTRYGGLTYDEANGWWHVNFDQIEAVLKFLMTRVVQLYAKGNAETFAAFADDYLQGEGFQLLHVDRIQEIAGAKPSAMFDYQLLGLG